MNLNHGHRPYVLVHGMGGAAPLFDSVRLRLDRGEGCIAHDMPGHGARAHEPPLSSVEELADDLARLHAAAAPFVVVGHSLGGAVAQALMVRHPALVEAIVLVSSALRFPAAAAMLEVFDADPAAARQLFKDSIGPAERLPLAHSLFDACAHDALRANLIALAAFDARPWTTPRTVERPALVIGGELDLVTPPKAWRRLGEAWGARIVEVAGGSHMLPEDAAADVVFAIHGG